MADLTLQRLRTSTDRASLIARYQELRKRLEDFLIQSARRDRAAHGTFAVSRGELFGKWLLVLRRWMEHLFDPQELFLNQPELAALNDDLIEFFGLVDLARQTRETREGDPRLLALLAGPQIMETWAAAIRNVVEAIDADDAPAAARGEMPPRFFDGYAAALARWVIDLPPTFTAYRVELQRSGIRLQKTDALRSFKALAVHRDRLRQWLAGRDAAPRARSLAAALATFRSDPRDGRLLPILRTGNFNRLSLIADRAEFYLWIYELFADLGHDLRWPLAAHIVARAAGAIANAAIEGFGTISNELQAGMRIGNQVIFDDALPKLKAVFHDGLLNGPRLDVHAVAWDARTLAEEQHLVQPMYATLSQEDIEDLHDLATQGFAATVAGVFSSADSVAEGKHNKAGDVPAFAGSVDDLKTPRKRWDYGMLLADQFSRLVVTATPTFPEVGAAYRDGMIFRQVNARPKLHLLDALLDDKNPDEEAILAVLKELSPPELAELQADLTRITKLRSLDQSEEDDIDNFLNGLQNTSP